MDNPIGNSFTIPDHLIQSIKKLSEQKVSAYESAKMFMQEAEKINASLNTILVEHIEVLRGHKFVIDTEKMIVTVIDKS